MRSREDIQKDGTIKNDLIIEVLLDIRDLLNKPQVKVEQVKRTKRKRKTE